MDLTILGFAFSAGAVAFLSPCVFALLPAYISYYFGMKDNTKSERNFLRRGIMVGFVCAAGAVFVLSTIGLAVSFVGSAITPHIPALRIVVGIFLIVLGLLTLFGIPLSYLVKSKVSTDRSYWGMFGFGSIYALGSAGCVAPVFIGVVTLAASSGFLDGIFVFLAYSAGLSSLLVLTTLLVASAKEAMISKLANIAPHLKLVSGAVMMIVGAYLALLQLATA